MPVEQYQQASTFATPSQGGSGGRPQRRQPAGGPATSPDYQARLCGKDRERPMLVECPPDGVSCKFDWLTFTGPANLEAHAESVMVRWFGEIIRTGTAKHYTASFTTAGGANLSVGKLGAIDEDEEREGEPERGRWKLDLSGSVVSQLTLKQQIEFIHELGYGVRYTRADVAVDVVGQNLSLVEKVWRSCTRGEAVGPRQNNLKASHDVGGVHGVQAGKRGAAGSGRYFVCYDKGIEQGLLVPRGHWQRWEVAFYGDCALQVVSQALDAVHPAAALSATALGAIEFRKASGSSDRHLSRRPEVPWYASFKRAVLGQVEAVRVVWRRRASSLQGWMRWAATAWMPHLEGIAVELGCSVGEAVDMLWMTIADGEVKHKEGGRAAEVAAEVLLALRGPPGALCSP